MAKDPVCEASVDESQAVKQKLFLQHENKTFYFCSADCKEQFERYPSVYGGLGSSWNVEEAGEDEGSTPDQP